MYIPGTMDSVLIKGGVPISGVHIREVPLYHYTLGCSFDESNMHTHTPLSLCCVCHLIVMVRQREVRVGQTT